MDLPLHEAPLNEYVDELVSESQQATKNFTKTWEESQNFYRGVHWQQRLPNHRIPFTANYVNVTVKRLTALITDTKPTVEVKSRVPGLGTLTQDVLTPTIRANWDEQGYDQRFAGGVVPLSIILGSAAVNVGFDFTVGSGGDIVLPVIHPQSLILDPLVQRTVDIDQAEYSGWQTVLSLGRIRQLFPEHGKEVEADSGVSRFLDRSGVNSIGLSSPGHQALSRYIRPNHVESYAVPRARVQEIFVNDYRTVGELPVEVQERFLQKGLTRDDRAWPGGRRIVRAGANKKILIDGPNPYVDRKTPIVMFDWGLETEHPWGQSEVQLIKSLQAILNKLGSSIVENAIKMNNNIWIGDRDALEKSEWGMLNDAPGLLVKLKPGRTLRRESAPALPGSVFQMMQWIVNTMDTLTGLVDVTQGKRPIGVVSSHAIEALNLAAQTLIRLQARKFENFLERVGQRLIARIFQFFTGDRMMHSLGEGGKWKEFQFEREKLLRARGSLPGPDGTMVNREFDYTTDLDLLRFMVTPGSSMAISRLQKAQLAMGLYQAHLIRGLSVLKVLEWDDPEGEIQGARAENMAGVTGEQSSSGGTKRTRMAA